MKFLHNLVFAVVNVFHEQFLVLINNVGILQTDMRFLKRSTVWSPNLNLFALTIPPSQNRKGCKVILFIFFCISPLFICFRFQSSHFNWNIKPFRQGFSFQTSCIIAKVGASFKFKLNIQP